MEEKSEERLSRSELIAEVSKETGVHYDVVEAVLEKLVDVAVEQVVNGRAFYLKGFFNITHKDYSGGQYLPGSKKKRPPSRVLKIALSPNVKLLYKLQRDRFKDKPFVVNRDTWRAGLKWLMEDPNRAQSPVASDPPSPPPTAENFNPLLDEDE